MDKKKVGIAEMTTTICIIAFLAWACVECKKMDIELTELEHQEEELDNNLDDLSNKLDELTMVIESNHKILVELNK